MVLTGAAVVCQLAFAPGTRGLWNASLAVGGLSTAGLPLALAAEAPYVSWVDCGFGAEDAPTCVGGTVVTVLGGFFGGNASDVTIAAVNPKGSGRFIFVNGFSY